MTSLIDRVRQTIERHDLLSRGDRVVVGISGGADSMALLHLLAALSGTLALRLHVAHLHHGLRPGADEDARFVGDACAALGLPLTVERADVAALAGARKQSVEEAGRAARYDLFARTAGRLGASRIATAHTRDDQVETVLMRLLQGGPWETLAGIRPRREGPGATVIRPLWETSRADVRADLSARGLPWREDPTNLDVGILRNRLRHQDLPALLAAQPTWPDLLWALGRAAQWTDDALDGLSARAYGHLTSGGNAGAVFARETWRAQPEAVQRRLLRRAVAGATGTRRALRRVLEDRMLRAAAAAGPGTEVAGNGIVLRVGYGLVEIAPPAPPLPQEAYRLDVPGEVRAEAFGLTVSAALEPAGPATDDAAEAVLDASRVQAPLCIRAWRPGDVFRPLGLRGKKKVQDYFVDAKVPRWQRRRVPLVVDADGEVVWVVGHRIAEPCRVHAGTERVLRLRVRPA